VGCAGRVKKSAVPQSEFLKVRIVKAILNAAAILCGDALKLADGLEYKTARQ
jgi:hypothetical protein